MCINIHRGITGDYYLGTLQIRKCSYLCFLFSFLQILGESCAKKILDYYSCINIKVLLDLSTRHEYKYCELFALLVMRPWAVWRSGLYVWLVMWRSWVRVPSKAHVVSLSKKLYLYCLVLVGSRNGLEREFTIKLK